VRTVCTATARQLYLRPFIIETTVRQGVPTGPRQRYAGALADLWAGLAVTLSRLEAIADDLGDDAVADLTALQYSLHRAGELAVGIEPPAGAAAAHADLRNALAVARDATGDVAEAVADGDGERTAALVPAWRGALLRVRLARHLLLAPPAAPASEEPVPFPWKALAGALLVTLGALGFTSGAVLSLWPLWAAGLALVAAGFLSYRP
jgi:hypothetical protein